MNLFTIIYISKIILLLGIGNVFIFVENRIFKLPRLILHADEYYLTKNKEVALSCQIEPGWRDSKMSDVYWMKDGVILHDINNQRLRENLLIEGPTLRILNGRYHAEGDYQCSAVIRGVRISSGELIDTRLVSAPVKFRRARTTKFEKVHAESINVLQGNTARIPCLGIPDVIPGPPELWFEKDEDGISKALADDRRYLITPTGMQIALSKLTDSGKYHCVIRNKFTNKTRRSQYGVKLEIVPGRVSSGSPHLLHPRIRSSVEMPIVLHVVKGKNVVLECMIASARVMWTKVKPRSSGLAVYNDRTRFQQLWGNLAINQLNEADEGIYMCEGYSIFVHSYAENPKVYYELRVHAPTDVQLMLYQNDHEHSWKLSCLALNLHYEIPMIYINGLPLVETMDELGVPPHTNFYTNPINATFKLNIDSSWSIQCISRPAMDEAEVYGNGLERGRAMNLYVDNHVHRKIDLITQGPENSTKLIGESVHLVCLAAPRTKKTLWIKDGKRFPIIGNRRIRLVGKATLKIMDIQPEDEGWYTCEAADNANHITRASAYLRVVDQKVIKELAERNRLAVNASLTEEYLNVTEAEKSALESSKEMQTEFWFHRKSLNSVQMRWLINESDTDFPLPIRWRVEMRNTNKTGGWVSVDTVEYPSNEILFDLLDRGKSYQFRVIACFDDNATLISLPSGWIQLDSLENFIPPTPTINSTSSDSMHLTWDFGADKDIENFIITYSIVGSNSTYEVSADNGSREILLTQLESATEYKVSIVAVHGREGSNYTSQPIYIVTRSRTTFAEVLLGTQDSFDRRLLTSMIFMFFAFIFITGFITFWLRRKTIRKRKSKNYMDTSWRIFQEHRALKSRLFYYRNTDFGMSNNEQCQRLNYMLNGSILNNISDEREYERTRATSISAQTDDDDSTEI